jgi:hypothetical protein
MILKAEINAKLYDILYFGLFPRQPARNEHSASISKSILAGAHHVCFIPEWGNIDCLNVSFLNHPDS